MTEKVIEHALVRERERTGDLKSSPVRPDFWAVVVFIVVLATNLGYHLSQQHFCVTFFGDSRHYLETCALLVRMFLGQSTGVACPDVHLADCLMMDGPILPLIPALYFTAISRVPGPHDWQSFVAIQSLLQAISAVVVYFVARRTMGTSGWALVASFMWGLYPAALIASGRFLTETPTALLMVAVAYAMIRTCDTSGDDSRFAALWPMALGCFAGIVLLLKPALLLLEVGVGVLTCLFAGSRRRLIRLMSMMIVGFSLVLGPWLVCSYTLTGKAHFVPQRAPLYNLAKGSDTEADGWGAIPESGLTALLATSPDASSEIASAWQAHGVKLINLWARKTLRLWSVPWNDFRVDVFGLGQQYQIWWQLLIMIFAFIGSLAILSGYPSRLPMKNRRAVYVVGGISFTVIVAHLAYCVVETLPRYGFTAMPLVILLAVFGARAAIVSRTLRIAVATSVMALLSFWWFENYAGVGMFFSVCGNFGIASALKCLTGICLLTACLRACLFLCEAAAAPSKFAGIRRTTVIVIYCIAMALHCAVCCDGRQERQWVCKLSPGDEVCRRIHLPHLSADVFLPGKWAAVLLDGDVPSSSACLRVNGHSLSGPLQLLYRRSPMRYSMLEPMRTFASRVGASVDDFRQFKIATFPARWLKPDADNIVELIAMPGSHDVTLFGDYCDVGDRYLGPSMDYFSPGKITNEPTVLDGRLLNYPAWRVSQSTCALIKSGSPASLDLSSEAGMQAGQYRLFLIPELVVADVDGPSSTGRDSSGGLFRPVTVRLTAKDFDPAFSTGNRSGFDLCVNRTTLKGSARNGCEIGIPSAFNHFPYVRVSVTGRMQAAGEHCVASIVPLLRGKDKSACLPLSSVPPCFKAGSSPVPIEIVDDVPTGVLNGGVHSLLVAVYPGYWEETSEYGCLRRCGDALLKDLEVKITPLNAEQVSEHPRVF